MSEKDQAAYVLRISPGGGDRLPEALRADQLIIGWAEAGGLLNPDLNWEQFRKIVGDTYHPDEPNQRKAGSAAGHLWRFIHDMKRGDLVVVPRGSEFFVAEVKGAATFDRSKIAEDSAYRREAQWLNEKKAIPRTLARSALLSRMKTQGSSAPATDLLDEINECLEFAKRGEAPTFRSDLHSRLVKAALEEILTGRIEDYRFERLSEDILRGTGAVEVRIVPRNKDKGADLLATFRVAGAFQQIVAVQAKHWQPEPPVDREVVEQLIRGIEAESANLGMVVTSGSISEDASRAAEQYSKESGIQIELIDGDQLAKLIVEYGNLTSRPAT